ncbi:SGNH/GDSL hydrolase family protein [Candidatus Nanohalobium constans]|uniref:Lysophospholipase L1 and related esterases family n=1 Tax=Candidatus Nanohalobium constans TaxID=2565781 RepID=A0A5Q0UFW8_9ARCH|nr:GDSL-type esterase/lipase family protein [Candidatus Nanohalobium constans]QGA80487.1 lysophospholipase L1 and related esterases family [Candidatus Nanohalobium constans]
MDNILVFGHSVTQGLWGEKGGWVQRLENSLVSNALETQDEDDIYYLFNQGVTGDTSEDLLNRLEQEYRNRTEEGYEDLLIIQIGANDVIEENGQVRVDPEGFRQNIVDLVELGKELSDELIFVGDFPVNPEIGEIPYSPGKKLDYSRLKQYEEIKKEVCSEKEVGYIDLFKMMENRNQNRFLEEGVHPTSQGHKFVYQKVKKELESKNLI